MSLPPFHPARTYDEALARVEQIKARDDDRIHSLSVTKFWNHGTQTPRAVLYLQGYTDSTHQFDPLGQLFFARGYNVFAPRLPYHGYKDRLTPDQAKLTTGEMIAWANEMTEIALGLGQALTVMGLSLGGLLATWIAQYRGEVERVVLIAPFYGNKFIPIWLAPALARAILRLPNLFLWWDPRVRSNTGIDYAYPRFATHVIARAILLGHELRTVARGAAPAVRRVWMVTNANDFAVNNALCAEFVANWRRNGANQVWTYEFPRALGLPHDLLDPAERGAQPDLVFARLIQIVEANDLPPAPASDRSHSYSSGR